MDEDLLVLLVPMIHLMPIECQVAGDRRAGVYRLRVTPHSVLGHAVADTHRTVSSFALEGAVSRVVALLQQVHADVLLREVVDGQEPRLVHQLHLLAVRDGLAPIVSVILCSLLSVGVVRRYLLVRLHLPIYYKQPRAGHEAKRLSRMLVSR